MPVQIAECTPATLVKMLSRSSTTSVMPSCSASVSPLFWKAGHLLRVSATIAADHALRNHVPNRSLQASFKRQLSPNEGASAANTAYETDSSGSTASRLAAGPESPPAAAKMACGASFCCIPAATGRFRTRRLARSAAGQTAAGGQPRPPGRAIRRCQRRRTTLLDGRR